jgi:hypothetical protein
MRFHAPRGTTKHENLLHSPCAADAEVEDDWCPEPDYEMDPDTSRHRQLSLPLGKHVDQFLITEVSMSAVVFVPRG